MTPECDGKRYAETTGLCPVCAADASAHYVEERGGMFMHLRCIKHGAFREQVERDNGSFRERYGQEYEKGPAHFVLPVTYRCNLKCSNCYTLSNCMEAFPADRPFARLAGIILAKRGNIMLAGGEPTVREDLPLLIRTAKEMDPKRKVSVATNGQKLHIIEYVRTLKESGLDFVFLSHNDKKYELSGEIFRNKTAALENCRKVGLPVWLSRTIDDLSQIDSLEELLEKYGRGVFNVTLRAAKPFGFASPARQLFVSDIVTYLGRGREWTPGRSPFNCYVRLWGKLVKICSWVYDVKRLDPIDDDYLISNDAIVPFHRGTKMDETILSGRGLQSERATGGRL
ncbi:MAG: radical SAM protein [Acidobacteriota bacterium]